MDRRIVIYQKDRDDAIFAIWQIEFAAQWRAHQPKYRLYLARTQRCKAGAGRDDKTVFLPERPFLW